MLEYCYIQKKLKTIKGLWIKIKKNNQMIFYNFVVISFLFIVFIVLTEIKSLKY
ncbi:MAG: hypothetical protein Q8844_02240 [Pigeon pea little leaf phytoplasma]|nr:hypothetical protein [Pigeon pea little leaf phytoplasma]